MELKESNESLQRTSWHTVVMRHQNLNKSICIQAVPGEASIIKTEPVQAIDSITDAITEDLKKGGKITLPGFGAFSVANRKARAGRNPRTGEEIRIPASRTAKFTPGNGLKETVR